MPLMGYDSTVYVGPYVKVFLPQVDVTMVIKTCPNTVCRTHGTVNRSTVYCGVCGHEIKEVPITKKETFNIYQMLMDRVGQDTFFVVTQEWLSSNEPEDFVILIPNRREEGGYNIEEQEFGEYILPCLQTQYFKQGKWLKVREVLDMSSLKHVDNIGIIKYYH